MIKRFASACFALAVAALPAAAFDASAMNDKERAAFQAEIRAYLLENPEVIFEAVEVMENRQAAEAAQQDTQLVAINAVDIFDDGYSWVGGNPDGDITLVEFVDYRCGYCRKAHEEVRELIASDGNIRFVVKELPILGDASVTSSRFAVAVKQLHGDGAYKVAHDAMITMRQDPTDATLSRLAEGLGYDAEEILNHMESDEVTAVLQDTRLLAQRLNISGTPSFVLQDEMLRGYLPLDAMRSIVAQKRG